jgi:hypothetical protein
MFQMVVNTGGVQKGDYLSLNYVKLKDPTQNYQKWIDARNCGLWRIWSRRRNDRVRRTLVVSHPVGRKKPTGWGTEVWWQPG